MAPTALERLAAARVAMKSAQSRGDDTAYAAFRARELERQFTVRNLEILLAEHPEWRKGLRNFESFIGAHAEEISYFPRGEDADRSDFLTNAMGQAGGVMGELYESDVPIEFVVDRTMRCLEQFTRVIDNGRVRIPHDQLDVFATEFVLYMYGSYTDVFER